MIINALCDYYDILADADNAEISPYGYQKTDYYYEVIITEEGELSGIIPLVVNKKEDKPGSGIMPKTMKIPGIAASPVCDNMAYIFGVDGKKGDGKIDMRKFEAAKNLHLTLLKNAVSREAAAIKRFFERWDPNAAWENEHIQNAASGKGTSAFNGNAAIKLRGETKYLYENDEISRLWLDENNKKAAEAGDYTAQCGISGEIAPIARIHTQLSGVKGANATGASLIGFNKSADESYNLAQSYNSRVSKAVEFKYTTALNYLLKSRNNKLYIGDDTAVFWALSPDSIYEDTVYGLFSGYDGSEPGGGPGIDRKSEENIKRILTEGKSGVYSDPALDPDVQFYVLGLAPNAGRVSVRYFYNSSFAEFCDKIKRYYDETHICGKLPYIKIGGLIFSTVSAKSSDKKVNPLLGGAVMRAVLSGNSYPRLLLNQIILRVKAEASVNQARAAAIKAYLIRNKKEVVTPMLNEASENQAYNLGRTFAVLEMIQRNASGGNLNATIKDKYFAAACSNPALVFPTLLKLAQRHLAKIEGVYWDKKLAGCLSLINGEKFPKSQNMDEQGSFILGYYQQTQELYKKKEDN